MHFKSVFFKTNQQRWHSMQILMLFLEENKFGLVVERINLKNLLNQFFSLSIYNIDVRYNFWNFFQNFLN